MGLNSKLILSMPSSPRLSEHFMMIHTYYTIFLVPLMSEAFTGFDDLHGLLIPRSHSSSQYLNSFGCQSHRLTRTQVIPTPTRTSRGRSILLCLTFRNSNRWNMSSLRCVYPRLPKAGSRSCHRKMRPGRPGSYSSGHWSWNAATLRWGT